MKRGEHSTLRDRQKSPNSAADDFQTPAIAIEPLIPIFKKRGIGTVWEPACGQGNLINRFARDFRVIGTDILTGQDFLTYTPDHEYDVIVTNPPYSLKDKFLRRCYDIGKPFALLLPLSALGGRRRQEMYRKHGLDLILLGERVNFKPPFSEGSSAWFESAWFTYGLEMNSALSFLTLPK